MMASKVKVCDAGEPWASNWRQIAEPVYRKDMDGAEIPDFDLRSLHRCLQEMEDFQTQWDVWDAPSAESICMRAYSKG